METIQVRSFLEHDFDSVQQLNEKEGWDSYQQKQEMLCSWLNSEPALIALDGGEVIGYLRGLTDGTVTLYVCELLVKNTHRNQGVAEHLIRMAHECYPSTRLEMLATNDSKSYYTERGFRSYYGFRKAAEEM